MKRNLKFRISKVTRTTIRRSSGEVRTYCTPCDCETEVITRDQAQVILQIPDAALDGMILAGAVHVVSTLSGSQWICKRSLFEGERSQEEK